MTDGKSEPETLGRLIDDMMAPSGLSSPSLSLSLSLARSLSLSLSFARARARARALSLSLCTSNVSHHT